MDGDIRPLEPADPREVAGHTLLGRLGSGGMGTVYLGADPESGGRVAVKTIHPHLAVDPVHRRRFKDEAYLASRVASFCTARVLAHGEEDGRPYLVTDYVGGVSLHDRLVHDGPLPPADLHGVAVGVASALAAIHAAGLVHRDLKPANVMLTLSGCRVIDFGIASEPDGPAAAGPSGQVLGTPGWMAPEVLVGGPATPAADIFAWGCLIAHAGTGQMPIGGDPATLRTGEPDLDGLPEPLVPAVELDGRRDVPHLGGDPGEPAVFEPRQAEQRLLDVDRDHGQQLAERSGQPPHLPGRGEEPRDPLPARRAARMGQDGDVPSPDEPVPDQVQAEEAGTARHHACHRRRPILW
ncbi:serine/threonine protein kinase [Actinomadura geliboluensis]|uniref:Serine/threonine protein kinase n=1 Tax=Actinomadura geliboluensis TaxID=882440 RepID=A0A5S4H4G1_9ACTN|nr:serine/threonine-protein kinase [Actinomadura geliboluensis]TMR39976.1 serine/threonine protein kinase [Actinomadura geliboluensis]